MINVTQNTDGFRRNPTIQGEEEILTRCYNLLVMTPGTDDLNPNKGCDIRKFIYTFKDDVNVLHLQREIKSQIEKYLGITVADVICRCLKTNGTWKLHVILTITGSDKALLATADKDDTYMNIIDTLVTETMKAT